MGAIAKKKLDAHEPVTINNDVTYFKVNRIIPELQKNEFSAVIHIIAREETIKTV